MRVASLALIGPELDDLGDVACVSASHGVGEQPPCSATEPHTTSD